MGDSVAMVVHGHDTTLPVTMEDMLVHCKAVSRGARRYMAPCLVLIAEEPPEWAYRTALATADRLHLQEACC